MMLIFFLHNRDTSGIINTLTWTEKNVQKYLDDSGYEVNKVRGNGFCILAAVARCLLFDHSYLVSIGQIQERIIQHLIRRPDLYEGFPSGTPEALATEAANFFEDKNFNRDLVDMLLLAVANALYLRIKIIRVGALRAGNFLTPLPNLQVFPGIIHNVKYRSVTHPTPHKTRYVFLTSIPWE